MNIMILGHKDHGKTTLAEILEHRFGFVFRDTTLLLKAITKNYLDKKFEHAVHNEHLRRPYAGTDFLEYYDKDKNSVRHLMVEALADYNKDNPTRFIEDRFNNSDIYAGCRSKEQYELALKKNLIDFTFWVKDFRKEENDPTMEIEYTPDMIMIDNSGTKLQLEYKVKKALHEIAGIDIRTYDKTLRDSIISNLGVNTSPLIPE